MRTLFPLLPLLLLACDDKLTEDPPTPPSTANNPVDTTNASNFGDPGTCQRPSHIVPGAGESNHLAATLITPPVWPWQLNAVSIAMQHDPPEGCNSAHPHEAFVWVVSDATVPPPADTPADVVFTWPEEPDFDDPNRFLGKDLDTPLILSEGDHVWVAIQFGGTVPDTSCVNACADGWEEGRNYWSNAAEPPYAWTELTDFNLETNLFIFALGERPL